MSLSPPSAPGTAEGISGGTQVGQAGQAAGNQIVQSGLGTGNQILQSGLGTGNQFLGTGLNTGNQFLGTGLGVGNQIASGGAAAGGNIAQAQQGYNTGAGISSQAGSMVNQSNPYGSLQYTQTGTGPNGTPIYTANTNLSPQQQQLFDQFMGTKGTAGGQAGSLLSGANYGSSSPTQAIGNMASGLEGQMMASYQAGNDPMQKTAREQEDTQLRNQGLQPGEPGYDNAMRGLTTSQTLANDTANANYAPQAFNQASQLYGMPAAMAESLGQFGSPTTPNQSFVNAPGLNIQAANLTGAVGTENQALTGGLGASTQALSSGLGGSNQALAGGLTGTTQADIGAIGGQNQASLGQSSVIQNQSQILNDQYKNQMAQYSGMMNGLFGIGSDALGVMTGGASLPFTSMAQGAMGGGGGGGGLV